MLLTDSIPGDVRENLIEELVAGVADFVRIASASGFGPALPLRDFELRYWRKGSSNDGARSEPSIWPIFSAARDQLTASEPLRHLNATAEQVAKEFRSVQIAQPYDFDMGGSSLVTAYFSEVTELHIDLVAAARVVDEFLRELTAQSLTWRTFTRLSGLKAQDEFDLAPGVSIRRVTQADLDLLARVDLGSDPFPEIAEDDWLCATRTEVSVKDYEQINDARRIGDDVLAALALTKPGRVSARMLRAELEATFLSMGMLRSGRDAFTSGVGSEMTLYGTDVKWVQRYFNIVRDVRRNPELEWLRLPIRRLRSASERTAKEDALVDFVIGLEHLLAPDGTSEVSYRFRIRGAAILSPKFGDESSRIKFLKHLYDLRSKVVHGGFSVDDVVASIQKAEDALRETISWFWKHGKTPKATAIALDEHLVAGGSAWGSTVHSIDL